MDFSLCLYAFSSIKQLQQTQFESRKCSYPFICSCSPAHVETIFNIRNILRSLIKEVMWISDIIIDETRQYKNYFTLSPCILTGRGLLGHAVGSIQGQDGVLGQGLLGHVVSFSGATAVTEQVQVSLPWPRAGWSCCCWSLCRSARHITGAHLERRKQIPTFWRLDKGMK